ncbi:hypothetical protein SeMB42_g06871 [Synchytrium endobioticum]|uniref:Uncharacterized protein n=1 Tax=Synchytrium endobioticum TaxID=286115 RepID=A0A507CEM1_9FUNG|nr:hypothetical protein SeMB42_g06871 [Synchytrium endobioticum]TPX41261.1 hypothetical protein SeLEV6574_g06184 [Synchytrium endobioticum]TPX46949.1 hypothetical protein SeLEV6574_g02922 [Synchytrium endobioticum]
MIAQQILATIAVLVVSSNGVLGFNCHNTPTHAECTDYKYPKEKAVESLKSICTGTSAVACDLFDTCSNNVIKGDNKLCDHVILLNAACADPMISDHKKQKGCTEWKSLCSSGTKVQHCTEVLSPTMSIGIPTTASVRAEIDSICDEMYMDGCECVPNDATGDVCPPLSIYSDLCLDMPGHHQCWLHKSMCKIDEYKKTPYCF